MKNFRFFRVTCFLSIFSITTFSGCIVKDLVGALGEGIADGFGKGIGSIAGKAFGEAIGEIVLELRKPRNPPPPTNLEMKFVAEDKPNAQFKAYFVGWYHREDGKEKELEYTRKPPKKKIKLKAKWSETRYQPENLEALKKLITDGTDLKLIDTSKVKSMKELFKGNKDFNNKDIKGWDVSEVTNMARTFQGATKFNQPLQGWNVLKVTNMESMFKWATAFNKDLFFWDVSKVTNFGIYV